MEEEREEEAPDLKERFRRACFAGDFVELQKICTSNPGVVWLGDIIVPAVEFTGLPFTAGTGLHAAASKDHVRCCQMLLDAEQT